MATYRDANRLSSEKSPYLLQHAHNPVDWYPWGREAFEKAIREGKIVLLSVGYSTCHWCHVMERETFEDRKAASIMNSLCVAVKVDREERPDIDKVYMGVCQALTGSGGWPLTVLLTPEGLPFFAGTYFPKESRHGRIGLLDLLTRAAALWKADPKRLRASGRQTLEGLNKALYAREEQAALGPEVYREAVEALRRDFDEERGGFGSPPKFPTPHNLTFLTRRFRRTRDVALLTMASRTLEAMARGGIFDHLGFGFHRYSTDAEWRLPHFEKMLYDQAGLATAYLEAYQATEEPAFGSVAEKIFAYVLRDLASPDGAFLSGEDADSEGVEGKFYVWTRQEILQALGAKDGEFFCQVYGILQEGNYRDEASGEKSGANVLHLARSVSSWALPLGVSPPQLESRLEAGRRKLLEQRARRGRPPKDDKVLTSWNGLMISALARGARVLGNEGHARAASRAANFLLTRLRPNGRLLHRYRDGEASISAFAEDYGFLARGLLDLYAASFDPAHLREALDLSRDLIRLCWDERDQGLFDTASDAEELVLRPREAHDGATPSANSVALEVFARLHLLTADAEWRTRAEAILDAFAPRVNRYPPGFTQFLQGASLLIEPSREVVLCGVPEAEDTRTLISVVNGAYAPETTMFLLPENESKPQIVQLSPHTHAMGPVEGGAAAYVCQRFACQAPITDAEALRVMLTAPP